MSDDATALAAYLAPAIRDTRVLAAIAAVPRDRFVPPELRERAYENVALPIGSGQTISQPIVVARMLEVLALRGDERVLDVGTGSGYHAALLARLAGSVVSIERHPELSASARVAIGEPLPDNLELIVGDGSAGVPELAPFDAINVAAAMPAELLTALVAQLAPGGRLVAPVSDDPRHPDRQHLVVMRSDGEGVRWRRLEQVRFVPLVPG